MLFATKGFEVNVKGRRTKHFSNTNIDIFIVKLIKQNILSLNAIVW